MKPWQTAKLAQFAGVLPAVCLRFKPNRVWSWTASSNNQSLWHKQIKKEDVFFPWQCLKNTLLHSQCTWPAPLMVCIIAGLNSSISCQNTIYNSVALYTLHCIVCSMLFTVLSWSAHLFVSSFFQRATDRDSGDSGCCWDKQAVRRSRGNPVSYQCRLNFGVAGLLTIKDGGFNP